MHAWEWLVTPDGELVKTDAADHCAAHDLIGCQDAAWDVAGASIELGLDANELASALARRGSPIDPALSRFYEPCYLAFQLGSHSMAARSIESGAPDEAARLRRAADTYARQLASWAR
jgi:hypothetical protein